MADPEVVPVDPEVVPVDPVPDPGRVEAPEADLDPGVARAEVPAQEGALVAAPVDPVPEDLEVVPAGQEHPEDLEAAPEDQEVPEHPAGPEHPADQEVDPEVVRADLEVAPEVGQAAGPADGRSIRIGDELLVPDMRDPAHR